MEKVVARLDRIFSVQDIMTSAEKLEKAASSEEARPLFSTYDVVPYPKMGQIKGFFQPGMDKPSDLKSDCLISDTTSLLNMPQLLDQAPFRFVISADNIAGYVHYSDLNKPAMKVPLFVLFQAMEKKLWDKIENKINESIVREVFQDNAQHLIKKQMTAIKGNVAIGNVSIGWIGVFTLPDILRLANHSHFKATNLSIDQIKLLVLTRNAVAHSDRNLIGKHRDVSKLVEVIKLCQSELMSRA
jgi:hypothetical protein